MRTENGYSRFIEDPAAPSSVLEWFRKRDLVPDEIPFDWGVALFFSSLGRLQLQEDGAIDVKTSPIVSVYLPKVVRGVLWTVGEAYFHPGPLKQQFPGLFALRRSFLRWIHTYPLVYDPHPAGQHEYDYYLEGDAKGWGPIHAFPSGLEALQAERYFVSWRETEQTLEKVCRTLRLRGVNCG